MAEEEPANAAANPEELLALQHGKVALICLVGALTLFFSRTPWLFKDLFRQRALDLMNYLSSFSSGIVFSAFLCHMLPESAELFSTYFSEAYASQPESRVPAFPFSHFLSGLVTFLLIALDRLVVSHGVHGEKKGDSAEPEHDHISSALKEMQRKVEGGAETIRPTNHGLSLNAEAAGLKLRRRKSEIVHGGDAPGGGATSGPSVHGVGFASSEEAGGEQAGSHHGHSHGHSHGGGLGHSHAPPHAHTHNLCLEGHHLEGMTSPAAGASSLDECMDSSSSNAPLFRKDGADSGAPASLLSASETCTAVCTIEVP